MIMSEAVIIVDLGTGFAKINTYIADYPMLFESKVGVPRFTSANATDIKKYKFDQKIPSFKGILEILDVFSSVQIHEKEVFNHYLDYIFSSFSSILKNSTLILGTPAQWSDETVNNVKTILFQKFDIHRIVSAPSIKFSLYYYDLENCTVLDLGHDQTRIIQYVNRKPVVKSIKTTELAGKLLTGYLLSLLQSKFTPIKSKQFQQLVDY